MFPVHRVPRHLSIASIGLPLLAVALAACVFGGSSPNVITGAQGAPVGAGSAAAEVTVTATDLKFDPATLRVPLGQPVRLTFLNRGAIEHDWEVSGLRAADVRMLTAPLALSPRLRDDMNAKATQGIPHAVAGPGQQMVITFTPTQPGSYQTWCTVPGHKEAGMVGQILVGDVAAAAPARAAPAAGAPSTAPATTSGGGGPLPVYAESGVASALPVAAPRLALAQVAPAFTPRTPRVVPVEIETRELVAQMDDGVAYTYWTFGGTVPGPMIRVQQGDTVELTLKNAPSSRVTHSIDLHAATGPGGGARVTQVAPGEQASFRFQALNPGVYVYHCATPPVAQHLANGMYGLIVVEPPEGLPPVDREFYVMQGDFYAQGARSEKGERAFSMDKMLDERPDYVVFNGSVGALTGDAALQARVGETVRIFFGVGGPNITSSFHVIGEIFDRVAPEGASNWLQNVQTTLVPAGGATIVEFQLDVPGDYVLVDHSLGRLAKGAAAILHVEGPENPAIYQPLTGPPSALGPTAH